VVFTALPSPLIPVIDWLLVTTDSGCSVPPKKSFEFPGHLKWPSKAASARPRVLRIDQPQLVPYTDKDLVRASRRLIRHEADVPVLLSAMASKPDWLLTHKTKHFTKVVAPRTSLRIATPAEFCRALSALS
jgi:hypothetical protein